MPVLSVNKALAVLDVLAFEDLAGRGLALSALARRVGQPVNTTHSQVRSLVDAGYAAQTDAGRYVAGPKCRQLGQWHRLQRPETLGVIESALGTLGQRLAEGVVFVALVDGQWVSVARRAPDQAIQVAPEAAHPDNIYTLTTGRILTAYASSEQLTRIVGRHGLPGPRWDNLRSAAALDRARAAVRAAGHARIGNETQGIVMLAVPVLAGTGGDDARLLGALGCYAPLFRCPDERQKQVLAHLVAAATDVARQLG